MFPIIGLEHAFKVVIQLLDTPRKHPGKLHFRSKSVFEAVTDKAPHAHAVIKERGDDFHFQTVRWCLPPSHSKPSGTRIIPI
jgi:hypothetical protein